MSTLSTVVFIPYWIAHTLRRRNLPYTAILDFKEMSKYFSPQDLALLLAANRTDNLHVLNVTQKSPMQLRDEENCAIDLTADATIGWSGREWYEFDATPGDSDTPEMNLHNTVMMLAYSDETRQALFQRLYSEEGADARFETPYAMIDLGRQHIGVVLHPGYFIETVDSPVDRELQFLRQYDLTRAILLALYVQAPGFHLVASSPVFLRYLGLLSKKRMILA